MNGMLRGLGLFDQLRYAHAEVLIDGDDFAARDETIVDEQIHGTAGQPIQFDNLAGAELEDIAHQHLSRSQLSRNGERDVHQ